MPPQGARNAKGARRTHHKSRKGCAFCKRRRIKCDEGKPACTNCVRRNILCEYKNDPARSRQPETSQTPAAARSSGTPNSANTSSQNGTQLTETVPTQGALQHSHPETTTLNLIDLELLSAWKDSTAPSIARFMSRMEVVNVFWRTTVPEIGFSYPFVLHACLALSGMHLSRFKRDRSHFYRAEAERHWAQGFSMATSQIRRVSDESYHALFIFSMLSCMYKLAKGPRAGDYLAFGGEQAGDASEWHIYYNGLLSFLTIGLDALRSGPLAQLFDIFTRRTRRFFAPEAPVDPDPIADLRALCTSVLGAEHPRWETYRAAIDNLARCYAVVFDGETDGEFDLFIWTLNISEEFIVCIQQREPVALAVFAYFVVLLNELSGWWVLDGWIHHLISGIYDALSEGARLWIRWPMEQTGWLPP